MKNSLEPGHILPWLISMVIAGLLYISTLSGVEDEADLSYGKTVGDIQREDLAVPYWNKMTCNLETLPIFPEDLKPYWIEDYGKNTTSSCIKLPVYTKLENRKLVVLDETKHCWGRCLNRGTDRTYSAGNWMEPGETIDCETIEVLCGNSTNRTEATFFNIHQQFVPKNIPTFLPEGKNTKYNVYIIMLDSVSHSHAKRTIPKTIEFLTKTMKAIEFPFMSRIGINTYPNMMPFLTGKRVEKLTGSLFEGPVLKLPYLNGCHQLGDQDNLLNVFKKYGYVTMFSDNYLYPIQASHCSGYNTQLATHVGDNFFLRLLHGTFGQTTIYPKHCFDLTKVIYNYLDSFINSYSDYPKMALIMEVWSSHDGFNDNQLNDPKLLALLEKNFEQLKDSFVFLISDHGAVYTHSGKKELNNPTTFVAVPESLRENTEILSILQENSKHLQTVMDTRETMLDIAKIMRRNNYTKEGIVGTEESTSSFLRTSVTAQQVGEAIVHQLNASLSRAGLGKKCLEWKLKKVISIEEFLEIPNMYVTEIMTTVADARFKAVIRYDYGIKGGITSFDRLDKFGANGNCVNGDFKHICHCKKPPGK